MALTRRGIVKTLLVVFVVVFVVWTVFQGIFRPYPIWPWEWAFYTARHVIRVAWAAVTGQSTQLDLFPNF